MAAFFAASIGADLYPPSTIQHYPLLLPALGAAAAVTAGVAKETLDSTGFGDPQWADLLHTAIGGFAAAGFVAAVERSPGIASPSRQAALFSGLGMSFSVPIAAGLVEEIARYLTKRRLKT